MLRKLMVLCKPTRYNLKTPFRGCTGVTLACLLIFIGLTDEGWTQEPDFQIEASATLWEVRVTDGQGQIIQGLRDSDFRVLEEAAVRPVTFFREVQTGPVAVALMLDVGSNMDEVTIRAAKQLFLDLIHLLDPEDQILLATYDSEVHFLSSLTRQRNELLEGIWLISPGARAGKLRRLSTLFGSNAYTGSAVDQALRILRDAESPNRILVVISAGFGNIGVATQDHLLMSGARFFAVSASNKLGDSFGLGGDKAAWQRIVRVTGGLTFDAQIIDEQVEKVRTAIKNHYLIAYSPEDSGPPLVERKVEFQVIGRPDLVVHAGRKTRGGSTIY